MVYTVRVRVSLSAPYERRVVTMTVYLMSDVNQRGTVIEQKERNDGTWYKVKWDTGYYSWHAERELIFEY
jgi:hypothetical protein